MSNYCFEFTGELTNDQNKSSVIEKLARTFEVSKEEIEPLFNGTHKFVRDGLDQYTAKAYQATFKKCGAIGNVYQSHSASALPLHNTELSYTSAENNKLDEKTIEDTASICPKCSSSNVEEGHCLDCGIYIEKYLRRVRTENSALHEQITYTQEDIQDQKSRRKAINWLITATILLTAVEVIDKFLQANLFPGIGQIDLGWTPYLFVHAALVRGCFLYAKSKGYAPRYGLWGLLSYAGLSVLLLLPDKDARYNHSSGKQKIFATLCIGLCIYWTLGFLNTSSETHDFYKQAETLASGRSEYPNPELNEDNNIYLQEHEEILAFIHASLTLLEENNYRSNQVKSIAGRMFQELARYGIWRNYQRYLLTINGKELPNALTLKEEKSLYADIRTFFPRPANPFDQFSKTSNTWAMGISNFEKPDPFWINFKEYQMLVWEQYRIHYMQTYDRESTGGILDNLTLAGFDVPEHKAFQTTVNEYTITFSTGKGPLAKRPLTMAFYLQPYEKYGKQKQRMVVEIISHQLPHRFIQQPFNILSKFKDY